MKTKFKIGDMVSNGLANYIIIDIVFDETNYIGTWGAGDEFFKVSNCYIVKKKGSNIMEYSKFKDEHLLHLASSNLWN